MEQIDFSEYKLSKYDMNKLGFLFHKNKDNPEIILQAITFFGLENLHLIESDFSIRSW